jgi:hypothetical protein
MADQKTVYVHKDGDAELNDVDVAGELTLPVATVAATGSVQGDAAALPESGFVTVSAADATKGVRLPAAVAGRTLRIKNLNAAVLKLWPATGDAINAIAANSSMNIPASTAFTIISYDGTTWYTIPLVPS